MSWFGAPVRLCLLVAFVLILAANSLTSIVTGANGYVGRAVIHELLTRSSSDNNDDIVCLVRPHHVQREQKYWNTQQSNIVRVLPYDMLDHGESLEKAIRSTSDNNSNAEKCIFHLASVFGPTENHTQTALDNVQGTVDLVRTLGRVGNCKLILTSSMAAVRGTGQEPLNGKYYTADDWNTISTLGTNWGSSYQWSKAESEKRAWELCKECSVPMIALCPSFVFGPTTDGDGSCSSYSWTLVGEWARCESPVQSRLCVDVRDAAKIHVEAALCEKAIGKRYIVSTEARVPSQQIASWLRDVCHQKNLKMEADRIHYDDTFRSGSIPIGAKEVESTMQLQQDLGVSLRPVSTTIADMAHILLERSK